MKAVLVSAFLVNCLFEGNVFARDQLVSDHNVHGALFEIGERSLLEVIAERMTFLQQTGKLKAWQQAMQKHMRERIDNPTPVARRTRARESRKWVYDPTLVVSQDIRDTQGQVIVEKGTRLNPLDHLSWGVPLLFLDSSDPDQLNWAEKYAPYSKWVLVKGKPLTLSQALKRPIYFDQAGLLTKRFKIQHFPARVFQEGRLLAVEEMTIN